MIKSPSNYGIVGAKAFVEVPNGILFVGQMNKKISGIHLLSGLQVAETADDKLRTRSIAERMEADVLAWPSTLWSEICCQIYKNRIFIAAPLTSTSTQIDGIWWFDVDRLGDDGQPGSWCPWDGIEVRHLWEHGGELYGGSSSADGQIVRFNSGAYQDADGSAINSYFWTKEIGGDGIVEGFYKDFPELILWYELKGAYYMDVHYRVDGSGGEGELQQLDLTPGGSLWGTLLWGAGLWGGGDSRKDTLLYLGNTQGRRIQLRFDNQNTAGQSFQVHRAKLRMNLRRQL